MELLINFARVKNDPPETTERKFSDREGQPLRECGYKNWNIRNLFLKAAFSKVLPRGRICLSLTLKALNRNVMFAGRAVRIG